MLYRNGILLGLPMFSLGIFIREYRDKILETYRLSTSRLVLLLILGMIASVIQWRGMGVMELPFGTLLEVVALILLLDSTPVVMGSGKWACLVASKFGELSTYIYISHLFWVDIYTFYIKDHLYLFGEGLLRYLSPVFIVLISFCSGVLWIVIKAMIERLFATFTA